MFFGQTQYKFSDLFAVILGVFIALVPFLSFHGYLYEGSSSRSLLLSLVVGFLGVLLGIFLFSRKNAVYVVKSPILFVLGGYFFVLIISLFFGVDQSISFWSRATRTTGVFYLSHLALFFLLLTMIFQDVSVRKSILKTFVISSILFSIGYLVGPDGFKWIFSKKGWDGFTFMNSSFAAMYLYAAFMASLFLLFSRPKENRKWWYVAPLLLLINPSFINPRVWSGDFSQGFIGESFASSYAVLFSIISLIIFSAISKIKKNNLRHRLALGITFAAVVLAIVAIASLLTKDGYIQKLYLSQSSGARPIVWELSQKAIKERPVFGWGPDNFDIAYQQHYDNRILEERNGAEPWFDRAHNIFIDQMVETGFVGTFIYILVYLVLIASMFYVVLYSQKKDEQLLGTILGVYFFFHIAELQTAFETSISYIPLAIMSALATVLFFQVYKNNNPQKQLSFKASYSYQLLLAISLFLYFGWSLFAGTLPIMKAEKTNGVVRTVGSGEKRLPLYEKLFGSPLDLSSFLWRTSTDFQRGIAENPVVLENPKKVEALIKELDIFAFQYEKYLKKHPEDIRSHLSLADIYIYYRLFDIDKLDQAHKVLDKAIALNPNLPQPYRMKAVAYLYQAKFKEAREWAEKALAVNPNIEESQRLNQYIERSIKTFPEIDLYFFKQI